MKQTLVTRRAEWNALEEHFSNLKSKDLKSLFAADPERGTRLAVDADGLYLDYSKNRLTEETLSLLVNLAKACGLSERRAAMFRGEQINPSEQRAVLHTALRASEAQKSELGKTEIPKRVAEMHAKMAAFAHKIRSGTWRGSTGKPIRKLVNIGIGGSECGPAMACEALRPYCHSDLETRFVSNVDASDFSKQTCDLDPRETLFIVVSKSFNTQETLTNAHLAKSWCRSAIGKEMDMGRHFVAVSANPKKATDFGVDPQNIFELWDWVGGRYSLCSAVGLVLMVAIGAENFAEMLTGFRLMDKHFRRAPLRENMPVLMALIGIWYNNFFKAETCAVLPYSKALQRFPEYLQQVDMESNGKSVTLAGERVDFQTGPILWGRSGTNGQHAFYQLLHQGTKLVPCDFIGFCRSNTELDDCDSHAKLLSNMFAQSQTLAFGCSEEELRASGKSATLIPQCILAGNQPSNTILAEKLTPRVLGQLIALYEHKIFTQGIIWGINSFDQWGVEQGKKLANKILAFLKPAPSSYPGDSSTRHLIERFNQSQRE